MHVCHRDGLDATEDDSGSVFDFELDPSQQAEIQQVFFSRRIPVIAGAAHHEVPERVEDESSVVVLDALNDMGVMPYDQVDPEIVDGPSCQALLQ